MASAYSSWSTSPSGGSLRRIRMYVSTSQSNSTNTSTVTVTGYVNCGNAAQYGIATVVGHNGGGGTSAASHTVATGVVSQNANVARGSHSYSFTRKSSAYNVTFYAKNKNQTVSGYGAWNGPVVTASVSVTIPALAVTVPGEPSNVVATYSADNNIKVTWTLNKPSSGSISSNAIQVQVDDGSWTTLSSSLSGSATSYTYTGGSANHRYQFRVSSTSSAGSSGYSEESGYVYTSPPAPTGGFGVAFPNAANTQYTNGATAIVSNIKYPDSYEWQRSTNNSTWTTVDSDAESSISETLTTTTLYYYRCRAVGPTDLKSAYTSGFRVARAPRLYVDSSTSPEKIFINLSSGSIKGVYYQTAQGKYHIQ